MEEVRLAEGQIFCVGDKRYVVRHKRIFRVGDPLRSIDPVTALKECCREFGVTVADMASDNRKGDVSDVRRLYCYIMRNYSQLRASDIAPYIHRKRSVVITQSKSCAQMMEVYPQWQRHYEAVAMRLGILEYENKNRM